MWHVNEFAGPTKYNLIDYQELYVPYESIDGIHLRKCKLHNSGSPNFILIKIRLHFIIDEIQFFYDIIYIYYVTNLTLNSIHVGVKSVRPTQNRHLSLRFRFLESDRKDMNIFQK